MKVYAYREFLGENLVSENIRLRLYKNDKIPNYLGEFGEIKPEKKTKKYLVEADQSLTFGFWKALDSILPDNPTNIIITYEIEE